MDIGAAVGSEGSEGNEVNISSLVGTVVEKSELLASYPLIRGPLSALYKPLLALRELLEQLTALSRRPRWVCRASRRCGVDEIEAPEFRAGAGLVVWMDSLTKLLVEVRALGGLISAALGVAGPGMWIGRPSGSEPGGGAPGGAAWMGVVLLCGFERKTPSFPGPYRYVGANVPL